MAFPAWHPALPQADSRAIERVQKSALSIILGEDYVSYNSALDSLNLESLEERRSTLWLRFAMKSASHPTHSKWFKAAGDVPDTRTKNTYQPVWTRTKRFKNSPIPYMTDALNVYILQCDYDCDYESWLGCPILLKILQTFLSQKCHSNL